MSCVYFEPRITDDQRREILYGGALVMHRPLPSALALVDLARELIGEAFGDLDPELAQHRMPVEEFAARVAALEPKFIHHPRAKEILPALLREAGCDPEQTHFDVPRMRTSTSGYLSSGIAYAFHPHRDTWYSAPMCQLNWWLPIYEIQPSNSMAFHPRYWSTPVPNSSREYNHAEWNRTSRLEAARSLQEDTRKQPRPLFSLDLEPQVRLVPPVGGMILFSGAHLHSTVPNHSGRTRFSIDFRTVHLGDALAHRGAINVDSSCTGTTMRDYLRASDLAHIPEQVCREYEGGPPPSAESRLARAG